MTANQEHGNPAVSPPSTTRFMVAAWYREGMGGVHQYDTLAEALSHRKEMMGPTMGFKFVHVWKVETTYYHREKSESKAVVDQ